MDVMKPVPADKRTLDGVDFFLLWAGAAISLAEIWAGGILVPLGFGLGVAAVLVGHLIGNTPLALGSLMGGREGLPSMIATRPALGPSGSYAATGLNIIQLIGWTGVMLWIGGHAATGLSRPLGENSPALWIIVLGVGTTVWAFLGSRHWRWLNRISISLLLALCLIMAWLVWRKMGAGLLRLPASGGLPFGIGLDLVIAMPISWVPLAADYARFARRPGPAAWGTWIGYFIVSSGMYALGLVAALATGSQTPEAMIMALMAETGWLAAAILIVLLSTFTTTFLDVYSTAVSNLNLPVHLSEKTAVIIAGALGTAIALAFSAYAYEPFLLYIGSFFCPLFGVILGDYFLTNRGRFPADWQKAQFVAGFNLAGVIAWAAGFVIYRLALAQAWPFGSSLPSFLAAGLIYFGLRTLLRKERKDAGPEGG